MPGAFQAQRRQIEDLAALKVQHRFPGEILTALTLLEWVNLDVLGILAALEGAAGVAGLTTGWAPGLFAQALGLGPAQAGRWREGANCCGCSERPHPADGQARPATPRCNRPAHPGRLGPKPRAPGGSYRQSCRCTSQLKG